MASYTFIYPAPPTVPVRQTHCISMAHCHLGRDKKKKGQVHLKLLRTEILATPVSASVNEMSIHLGPAESHKVLTLTCI